MTSPFTNELPKKEKHSAIKEAVCQVIDLIGDEVKFTPRELYKAVVGFYPDLEGIYIETILRYMRMYRRESVICIDRNKSLYQKVVQTNKGGM